MDNDNEDNGWGRDTHTCIHNIAPPAPSLYSSLSIAAIKWNIPRGILVNHFVREIVSIVSSQRDLYLMIIIILLSLLSLCGAWCLYVFNGFHCVYTIRNYINYSYSDPRYNDNMVIQEELHHDTRLLEEREQHMRQLEVGGVEGRG